jgi:hypothetical protein
MSLKYRSENGTETPVAGLNGTSGELVPSVALYQKGSKLSDTESWVPGDSGVFSITFSTPMPDADYDVIVGIDTPEINVSAAYDKTVNGFKAKVENVSSVTYAGRIEIYWQAFKLMTDEVHEADASAIAQNTANFAPTFSETTSYAVGDYVTYNNILYRCTTAHTAGVWVAGHFTQTNTMNDVLMLANNAVAKRQHVYNADANDFKQNGVWFTSPGWSNLPTGGNYGTLVMYYNTNNEGVQVFFGSTSGMNNKIFFRTWAANVWSSWQQLTSNDHITGISDANNCTTEGIYVGVGTNIPQAGWNYLIDVKATGSVIFQTAYKEQTGNDTPYIAVRKQVVSSGEWSSWVVITQPS